MNFEQAVRQQQHAARDAFNDSERQAAIIRALDLLTAPYFEYAEFKKKHQVTGGGDALVAMGLDIPLERYLGRGIGIPTAAVDDLLVRMSESGSRRGVEICLKAGGDPLPALASAENNGQRVVADILRLSLKARQSQAFMPRPSKVVNPVPSLV